MNIIGYMLFLFVHSISSFLNENELSLSFDLTEKLQIRSCIFVRDLNQNNLISNTKEFSRKKLQVTHLDYDRLIDYLLESRNNQRNTGLIFKEKDFNTLERITTTLEQANETYRMCNFIWLVFLQNYKDVNNLTIPYDCEFILAHPQNEESYQLKEIYRVKDNFFTLEFGIWDCSLGLNVSDIPFYDRRLDFKETEIIVLSLTTDESVTEENYAKHESYDVIDGLSALTNLSIDYRVRRLQDNDSKIFDIMTGRSSFNLEIPGDKLGPLWAMTINWYIKHPKVEMRSDYYLQPFETNLWLALLSLIIIGTAFILIQDFLMKNKNRNFIDGVLLSLELFCDQCGNDVIESASLRTICLSFGITAVLVMTFYGADLTSYLSVEIPTPPFKNIEEFAKNGQYRLFIQERSLFWFYFEETSNDFLKSVYHKFKEYYYEDLEMEEILERICFKKLAALFYEDDVYDYKSPCPIFEIPTPITKILIGFFLKEHCPFTKVFNKKFQRFRESGVLYRIATDYKVKRDVIEDFQPVKLEQMVQLLSFPLIGVILGVAIAVGEAFFHKIHSPSKTEKRTVFKCYVND